VTAEQLTLLLNTAIAVFLPALVGLVTTKTTNPTMRALLLLGLSIAQTLIGQILIALGTGDFDWFTWALSAIGSFVVGVATHFGFWKPSGASDALIAVGSH
jgi:hypothetical protein